MRPTLAPWILLAGGLACLGCRGYQYGHLVKDSKPDMVGSHSAGAEVYTPLVQESVAKLLGACEVPNGPTLLGDDGLPLPRRVCFVGVENKSAEELGDFKEQLTELIGAEINRSQAFEAISRRMVDAALHETRLRPDSLFVPSNMQLFTAVLQRQGPPIDYLLFAKLTSGTTERNSSSQRDYLLTLDLVDVHTGRSIMEQATIRKGYHRSPLGKLNTYGWFSSGQQK